MMRCDTQHQTDWNSIRCYAVRRIARPLQMCVQFKRAREREDKIQKSAVCFQHTESFLLVFVLPTVRIITAAKPTNEWKRAIFCVAADE